MNYKAIFRRKDNGKFYTVYNDANGNQKVAPVYLPKTWWDKSAKKYDKKGQEYIVASLEKKRSLNGNWDYFILPSKED